MCENKQIRGANYNGLSTVHICKFFWIAIDKLMNCRVAIA